MITNNLRLDLSPIKHTIFAFEQNGPTSNNPLDHISSKELQGMRSYIDSSSCGR